MGEGDSSQGWIPWRTRGRQPGPNPGSAPYYLHTPEWLCFLIVCILDAPACGALSLEKTPLPGLANSWSQGRLPYKHAFDQKWTNPEPVPQTYPMFDSQMSRHSPHHGPLSPQGQVPNIEGQFHSPETAITIQTSKSETCFTLPCLLFPQNPSKGCGPGFPLPCPLPPDRPWGFPTACMASAPPISREPWVQSPLQNYFCVCLPD